MIGSVEQVKNLLKEKRIVILIVIQVLRAQNVMITHNNVAKIDGFDERAILEENDTATVSFPLIFRYLIGT